MEDSRPAVRQRIAADLVDSAASAIDAALLEGTGSNSPTGIRTITPAVGTITSTELATNGRTPTLDDVDNAIGRMEDDDLDPTEENAAIVMAPRTWHTFRQVKDSDGKYLIDPDPASARRRSLFGLPVLMSTQISVTETVGSNSDNSWIAVVYGPKLAVSRRQRLQVKVSEEFRLDVDQTAIRAIERLGFGVAQGDGVQLVTGVRP